MFYTHTTLDRADHLRANAARIAELRAAPTTRLIPVWRGTALVSSPATGGAAPSLASLAGTAALPERAGDEVFLGLTGERAWFAVPVSRLDDAAREALAGLAVDGAGEPIGAEFADVRVVGPALPADEGALLAFARGLCWWQERIRFCSECGRPLRTVNAGHVRACDDPDGAHTHFPRTDPAVIMLVIHDAGDGSPERCLLGRNAGWPEGVFSTLAGFVEAGESLEQAVSREVAEESSVLTTDVRYVASQPWPFPRSIMLGFEARAISTAIRCEPTELADARWFTREQIVTFGNWGDGGDELKLPRPDSIARFLIDRWLARGDG